MEKLFRGEFDSGVYPDEWYGRPGFCTPQTTKEIVNSWKSSPRLASVILNPRLGKLAAELMSWETVRLAQDDCIIKPARGGTPIAFHQDGRYISDQFVPRENNSVTVWIPLTPITPGIGGIEYAEASHRWEINREKPNFHVPTEDYKSVITTRAGGGTSMEKVLVDVGDIVVHHQDTWHGSGVNESSEDRYSLVVHLLSGEVEFRGSPHPSYIYGRYYFPDICGRKLPETAFPMVFPKERRSAFLSKYCEEVE